MTVFNHFPGKKDMFFDRDEEGREMLRKALRERDSHVAPIETLRLLAHRLVAEPCADRTIEVSDEAALGSKAVFRRLWPEAGVAA